MKQLKTAHVELQATTTLDTKQISAATPTTTTGLPMHIALTIKGSGDEILPDQAKVQLSLNKGTAISAVMKGNKFYFKNAEGTWYVLSKQAFQGATGNPFSGANLDQNQLLSLLQQVKIADNGTQSLNGQKLRHLTAMLDKDGMHQLLNSNPQLGGSLGLSIDAFLKNIKTSQSSIDVWVDESTFYVHRMELKLSLTIDTAAVIGTSPTNGASLPTMTLSADLLVDLSKFNVPVIITQPANAIPTDNPAVIFGLGGQ